ncbi:putative transcription factor C2H2 family [Helianthus annuus]|nr:putative transcription factor C2H2 family [Helianthus annuus]KAJ0820976.1 putative transcription factor C2H2 family [Helianthus annuus]KAJ0835577.1 putative transcription factor C2H2 family [Helianthus annuus]
MDLSKLPDSQRQELEKVQKQFQEHQAQQQHHHPPPPYDPYQVHQPSYYYNPPQQQQQYDPSYYHFQDPYVPNLGYHGPPGINPATAAAAVAALSQLTHFAGGGHYDQGHFRPPVGHNPYRGGGSRGGGPFRGSGRGNTGFRPPHTGVSGPPFNGRGRGRDRGRGKRGRHGAPSSHPESSAQPPVQTARCEVCKVDCTTGEVLEQHNNGKRHKRNLRKLQDRKAAHQPVVQTERDAKPDSDNNPGVETNKPEGEPEPKPETEKQTDAGDDNNKAETEENDNQEKKPRMKRKMKGRVRGTRGGAKRMRPTGPRTRKAVIPLVCDLCNIKCDTQEVFDRHAAGKKHLSKLKRFEGHQAMYGPTAVQALYPPNPLSQTLAPQPAYYGASTSYPAPPEAYIPPPVQAQNPNPQLADAPLEFATQNAVLTG